MTEPRRISLTEAKKRLTGGDTSERAFMEDRCLKPPIGCGKTMKDTTPFRNRASRDEYAITGLCQDCQDKLGEGQCMTQ